MKPTYLAAALAAAVTLTGMSTPAHAGFTTTLGVYDPDLGETDVLDVAGDQFTFGWQGSGDGSFDVFFNANSSEVSGTAGGVRWSVNDDQNVAQNVFLRMRFLTIFAFLDLHQLGQSFSLLLLRRLRMVKINSR